MKAWKLIPLAVVAACSTAGGEQQGPIAGSPEWFETATQRDMIDYFRGRCVAAGVAPGTREMAECVQMEASLHNRPDVARSAAVAATTAAN